MLLSPDRYIDLRLIHPEMPDIGPAFFAAGWPDRLKTLDHPGQPLAGMRLGCPLTAPSKIICLGKNYVEHAKEGGFEAPVRPLLFGKAPNALCGPFDDIELPQSCREVDWEVELAVIIGKTGKRIPAVRAADHIAGLAIMNDVSGREAQFSDGQWFRGKSFDTFAPLGPAIVTLDEISTLSDLQQLRLTTRVDGRIMQDGNTRDMIFDIPALIAYISQDITLFPGDVISTGTPAGVGYFRTPKILLQPGNIVECAIEKIGRIANRVV